MVSLASLTLSIPFAFAAAESDRALDFMHQLDNAYVQVYEKVAPSVVIVEAHKKRAADGDDESVDSLLQDPRDPLSRMPEPSVLSEGSGFVVRANGYILTNNHVIEGSKKIEVRLKDGRHFPAKVVGIDDKTDIAVLKIEAENLTPAPLADINSVRVGQQCFAIGSPYEQDYSFSAGHVSGKGRITRNTGEPRLMIEDYIQTDTFINPGNSGGPLFDIEGRVIGMNTLINGMSRNLAFAIPSNLLREIGDQLIAEGKVIRPWLGIRIETLGESAALSEQIKGIDKGAVVVAIEPESPAYQSDLRPTDVITAVDGVSLSTAHDLQKEVLKKKVGQTLELTVWRNGKTQKISIATGALPGSISQFAKEKKIQKTGASDSEFYGLQLQDIPQGRTGQSSNGVLVIQVAPGSPAAEADLQMGDVITEMDEKSVVNVEAFRKLLADHETNRGILLFIERKGQKTYTVLKPTK